ncbi:hypothetical protein [Sphingomonas ginsenosidimutans]|nr:hypothetical protein [Sphingomonas ginsenosidimutans]
MYAARFGSVSQPYPRGALSPSAFRTILLVDVLAAMLFRRLGFRIPYFIG